MRKLAICALQDGVSVATVDFNAQGSSTLRFSGRPEEAPQLQHFQVPLNDAITAAKSIRALRHIHLVIVDMPPGVEAAPHVIKALMHLADLVL